MLITCLTSLLLTLEGDEGKEQASRAFEMLWDWKGALGGLIVSGLAIWGGVARGWRWAKFAWGVLRAPYTFGLYLIDLGAEVKKIKADQGDLRSTLQPYADTWEAFGVCWAYGAVEGRNIPYCPLCRADGKVVPLDRSESDEGDRWFLSCHGHPRPQGGHTTWTLTAEEYDHARGHGVAAAQVVTSGTDRVRGEPRYGKRP